MFFDLTNDIQREQFREYADRLLRKGCVVRITNEQPRTIEQKSYFNVLLAYFASQTGFQPSEVEAIVRTLVCPDIFIANERMRSTDDLTSTEMQTVISRFRFYAATVAEIELPDADKYRSVISVIRRVEQDVDFIPRPRIKWISK